MVAASLVVCATRLPGRPLRKRRTRLTRPPTPADLPRPGEPGDLCESCLRINRKDLPMSSATLIPTSPATSSTAALSASLAARVNELLSYIRGGRILEAMREFYADDVRMQENNSPPTVGL